MKNIAFALVGLLSLCPVSRAAPSDGNKNAKPQQLDIPPEWMSFHEGITVTEKIEEIYEVGTKFTTVTKDEVLNIASNFVTAVDAISSAPRRLAATPKSLETRVAHTDISEKVAAEQPSSEKNGRARGPIAVQLRPQQGGAADAAGGYHSAMMVTGTFANQAPKSTVAQNSNIIPEISKGSPDASHGRTRLANKPLGYTLTIHDPTPLKMDNVTQAAGYMSVGPNSQDHLFFWFFESRSDPENDPVVLWLNGGPGCSSLEGMTFENGPSSVDASLNLVKNNFSWNNKANVIFLDQPVNTGFSYSQNSIDTTNKAAVDVVSFLESFFRQYPQFSKNKFHIAGESYAGHYIPAIANNILSAGNNLNFNLSSVLIGNGLIDPLVQYQYYQPMACGGGGVPSVLSQAECNYMANSIAACQNQIQQCYNDPSNAALCARATNVCENSQMGAFERTNLNVYDMRKRCDPNTDGLCYAGMTNVNSYFNQAYVKRALGIDSSLHYQDCNDRININFLNAGDWMQPYIQNVPAILNRNLPVLIYAGDKDFICNWLGNQAWTKVVNWQGRQQFSQAAVKQWNTQAGHVGDITNYQGFSFLRVFNAGHMVPHDQPRNSLSMLNQWLAGDYAFASREF